MESTAESQTEEKTGCCEPDITGFQPICIDDVTDDSDLPESYKRVVSFFSEEELNSLKILAILVYIIGVESGFTSDVDDDLCYTSFDLKNIERIVPKVVASGMSNNEECTFPLHLGPLTECVLRMKPVSGKFVVINLFSRESLVCFSTILDSSTYVTNTTLVKRKLKELSVRCKDDLFYPMKSFYLDKHDVQHACLLDLPVEIIHHNLFRYLGTVDMFKFRASCRYFWNNESIEELYKKILIEKITKIMIEELDLFQTAYRQLLSLVKSRENIDKNVSFLNSPIYAQIFRRHFYRYKRVKGSLK